MVGILVGCSGVVIEYLAIDELHGGNVSEVDACLVQDVCVVVLIVVLIVVVIGGDIRMCVGSGLNPVLYDVKEGDLGDDLVL